MGAVERDGYGQTAINICINLVTHFSFISHCPFTYTVYSTVLYYISLFILPFLVCANIEHPCHLCHTHTAHLFFKSIRPADVEVSLTGKSSSPEPHRKACCLQWSR